MFGDKLQHQVQPLCPPTPSTMKELLLSIFGVFLASSFMAVVAAKKEKFSETRVNVLDVFGRSPLFNACLEGNLNEVNKLLKHGADPGIPEKDSKNTPLHVAIERAAQAAGRAKSEAIVKMLIDNSKVSLTEASDSGWTPLTKAIYLAAEIDDYPLSIVEKLLEKCMAVNVAVQGSTPLHLAASSRIKGRAIGLVSTLIKMCDSSIIYSAVDSKGWSAVKVAMVNNNLDVVDILSPKDRTRYLFYGIIAAIVLLICTAGSIYVWDKSRKSKLSAAAKKNDDLKTEENTEDESENELETGD